jgi:hypothetical protein
MAGEEWEQKLHAAALALSPGAGFKSAAAELLLDIQSIFLLTGKKKMFTRALLEILREEDFAMKATALYYLALDECRLSEILRPYGVKSCTMRIGKDVSRGYAAEDFADALARYVPKADVKARFQEFERQYELWAEVKAEKDGEWRVA